MAGGYLRRNSGGYSWGGGYSYSPTTTTTAPTDTSPTYADLANLASEIEQSEDVLAFSPDEIGATSIDDPNVDQSPEAIAAREAGFTSTTEYLQYQTAIEEQQRLADEQQAQLEQIQQQYDDLATAYDERDAELSQYLEDLGGAERERLEQRREQAKATAKQDLLSRGITSTSALDAIMRGIDLSTDQSLRAFEEGLRQQKLDYRATFSGETLAAREQATQFGATAIGQNFAAGQRATDTMTALSEMLAQQRLAGFETQTDLKKTALANRGQTLSAILGHKADLSKIALGYHEAELGQKLGYAQLGQRERESKREADTARDIARRNQATQRVRYGSHSVGAQTFF